MNNFLSWCQQLGIENLNARAPVLTDAVKALSHESVLFFLCGRDYIYKPSDLKWTGIEALFFGRGKPYELNLPHIALNSMLAGLNGPGGVVGARQGAGNYNLCTKALESAATGMGATFLRDMVKGVMAIKAGAPAQVKPDALARTLMDMRNSTRRYWMSDLVQIGL